MLDNIMDLSQLTSALGRVFAVSWCQTYVDMIGMPSLVESLLLFLHLLASRQACPHGLAVLLPPVTCIIYRYRYVYVYCILHQ